MQNVLEILIYGTFAGVPRARGVVFWQKVWAVCFGRGKNGFSLLTFQQKAPARRNQLEREGLNSGFQIMGILTRLGVALTSQ